MPLDVLTPGSVRDVSVAIATWLVAQGYAEPEMRSTDEDVFNPSDRGPNRRTRR